VRAGPRWAGNAGCRALSDFRKKNPAKLSGVLFQVGVLLNRVLAPTSLRREGRLAVPDVVIDWSASSFAITYAKWRVGCSARSLYSARLSVTRQRMSRTPTWRIRVLISNTLSNDFTPEASRQKTGVFKRFLRVSRRKPWAIAWKPAEGTGRYIRRTHLFFAILLLRGIALSGLHRHLKFPCLFNSESMMRVSMVASKHGVPACSLGGLCVRMDDRGTRGISSHGVTSPASSKAASGPGVAFGLMPHFSFVRIRKRDGQGRNRQPPIIGVSTFREGQTMARKNPVDDRAPSAAGRSSTPHDSAVRPTRRGWPGARTEALRPRHRGYALWRHAG